ncbi:hypothetical protein BBJ28_00002472 [Nothophytophthora sp. Chile5]|nr:hypothetical protein BBJ28_00002472 [Nothophytophthora sp. Chile5]
MEPITLVLLACQAKLSGDQAYQAAVLVDAFLYPALTVSLTKAAKWQDKRLILRIAHDTDPDVTQKLLRHCNLLDIAAKRGSLEMVMWLQKTYPSRETTAAMDNAAKRGHEDLFHWFHDNHQGGCTSAAMDHFAANGKLNMVRFIHTYRAEGCTTQAMDCAAANGHLDVVRWLHENRTEGCTQNAMDHAASDGQLHVVQWLHANRSEGCTVNAMDQAAANGHLRVVLNHNSPAFSSVYGFRVPTKYAAWLELVVIHFLVPRSSFMGHMCGILAGYLYVYSPPMQSAVTAGARWLERIARKLLEPTPDRDGARGSPPPAHSFTPRPSAPPLETDEMLAQRLQEEEYRASQEYQAHQSQQHQRNANIAGNVPEQISQNELRRRRLARLNNPQ